MRTDINGASEKLVAARLHGHQVDAAELGIAPDDLDAAYAIQKEIIKKNSDRVGGWKVGCTNTKQQEMLGIDEPFFAPVFNNDIFQSPAALISASLHHVGVECEIIFVLGCAMPAGDKMLSYDDVMDALESIVPGFEIFSSRLAKPLQSGAAALTADCDGNGALVVGDAVSDWRAIDLSEISAELIVNNTMNASGVGATVLGSPLRSAKWFINKSRLCGFDLSRGDMIATGSLTPVYYARIGDSIEALYDELGSISLNCQ